MKMLGLDGQLHDVPDNQVQAAFLSGQYGFTPGSTVPVVTQTGDIGRVRAEEAQAAFGSGARIAGQEEYQKAVLQQQYGGLRGAAIAGAEGVARGVSVGLSDPLAIKTAQLVGGTQAGEAARKHLESFKEANPVAAGAGEIAGTVAPVLASGGTAGAVEGAARVGAEAAEGTSLVGRAARAATAVPRAISAAGELAEHAVNAAIGQSSERAFVRVAKSALAKGVGFGTEGALYGVGDQISEDALGDHETTAEKLYAAAGHGAVAGFLLGGLAGAGGEIAKYGISKAAPGITSLAETQAVRAINPKLANVEQIAGTLPGGVRGLGRWMLDNSVIKAGDRVDDVAERVATARRMAGDKLGDIASSLDNAGLEGPDGAAMLRRMDRVIDEVRAKPGFDTIANSVKNLRDQFEERLLVKPAEEMAASGAVPTADAMAAFKKAQGERKALEKLAGGDKELLSTFMKNAGLPAEHGLVAPAVREAEAVAPTFRPLTFTEARTWRSSLDDLLRIESSPLAKSPRDTELRKIRTIVEDEIEKAADRASAQVGGNVLADYKAAKLDYRYAAAADKIAAKESNRLLANRAISPTDYLTGIAGAATGHPMAALGALGHRMVRERGNATVAAVLDKVADFAAMSRATKDINQRIESAVQQYVNQEKPLIKGKLRPYRDIEPRETTRDTYDRKVAEVAQIAARMPKKAAALHSLAIQVGQHAPTVMRAVANKSVAASSFLASKIPDSSGASPSVQPQFQRPQVSDTDVARFLRYAQATESPMSVMDEMHRGTLTREHVEALKAVYPNIYQQLVNHMQTALLDAKKPLPYARVLQLGLLFDRPTDPTMMPQFVHAMQATFSSGGQGKGGKGAHPRAVGLSTGPHKPVQGIAESAQLQLNAALGRRR